MTQWSPARGASLRAESLVRFARAGGFAQWPDLVGGAPSWKRTFSIAGSLALIFGTTKAVIQKLGGSYSGELDHETSIQPVPASLLVIETPGEFVFRVDEIARELRAEREPGHRDPKPTGTP